LVVVWEVPVDRLLVGDPVGPDHAGVAHVDHVRVGDVEADPARDQEDGDDREQGDRQGRPQADAGSSPKAEPERSAQQVEERRVGERNREPDVPAVEEVVGEPEARDHHEQVEMCEPERPAPVEQSEDEDRAERQPDVGGVDHPAEGARVAAGHVPGDLVAGPRFDDPAVVRVDDHLHDLLAAGEEADLPEPGPGVAAGRRGQVRVLFGRGGGLRIQLRDLDRPGLADPGLLRTGRGREQQDE
jgi:hypothetical protein